MEKLLEAARKARENAHAPYSGFKVGAALETEDGEIITGCNVENVSYGLTVCAERLAIWKAVTEGKKKFKRIAIIADTTGPCPPCGACRQVLAEFDYETDVIISNLDGDMETMKIKDLLPRPFSFKKP